MCGYVNDKYLQFMTGITWLPEWESFAEENYLLEKVNDINQNNPECLSTRIMQKPDETFFH